MLSELKKELKSKANKEKSKVLARYFKTGKGEYGQGDKFLGITVPEQRKIAKKYFKELSFGEIKQLLESEIHEERFTALEILVFKYNDSPKEVFEFYVKNTKNINNWDLVDTSAPYIVGDYISNHMEHEERLEFIDDFIASKNLWENRIVVVATYYPIKKGNEKMIFYVAERLLKHKHDLIHKAIGWMLREVGKKNEKVLIEFLIKHYTDIPRTTLRYAIEKFDKETRKNYLKGQF